MSKRGGNGTLDMNGQVNGNAKGGNIIVIAQSTLASLELGKANIKEEKKSRICHYTGIHFTCQIVSREYIVLNCQEVGCY